MRSIAQRYTLSIATLGFAALGFGGPTALHAQQAALKSYQEVDFFYTQSPQLFAGLWQAAQSQTVRIAMLGDSQETSPTSEGYQYMPRLNYEMWQRFGNVPETPIEGCFYFGTTPPGDWLTAGGCSTPGPVNTRLSADMILPNVVPKAFSTLNSGSNVTQGSHGQLTLLEPNAIDVHASADIPSDVDYFNTSGSVKAQVFAGTNASSGEISYIARPTATNFPSYSAAPTTTGTLTLGLQSTTFAVKSGTTSSLDFNNKHYLGLEVFGSDDTKLTDIVGLRFFNETHPEGVIVDTFSHGGYTADMFLTSHANAGAMFKAFGFEAAIVHYGANEGGRLSAADFQTSIAAVIDRIRTWQGDPAFPVILIADVYQGNLRGSIAGEYDKYVGAELAIAQSDSNVMVINARRLMEDIGWNGTSGEVSQFLISDLLHYTGHGAQVLAAAEVAAMMSEIHVSGCVSDPGAVSLPATATVVVDLGGTSACSGYGQLSVAQAMTFNQATLNVALTNGFVPAVGQQFKVLSFGSASGAFAHVVLPQLASGLSWNTSALYTTGTIGVVKTPPAAPTISVTSGGSQTITSPAAPAPIAFTLTGTGTLSVTAQSSNAALLPASGISISSGCGAGTTTCTATLAPIAGQTGSATVTLAVADPSSQTASATATIEVNAAASTGGGSTGSGSTSGGTTGGTTGSGSGSRSGGGGGLDLLSLLALGALASRRHVALRRQRNMLCSLERKAWRARHAQRSLDGPIQHSA